MKAFSAYVDFRSPHSLPELAKHLSVEIFGDIPFVGLSDAIWDEVPALYLKSDFLGLRVELGGGSSGEYTLQVEPFELPESSTRDGIGEDEVGDLSWYLAFLIEKVEGITLLPLLFD